MIDTLKAMLFEKFVEDILTNPTRWLDDRIVQLAQILIKEKYPHINGLKNPAANSYEPTDGNFIQILNVNNEHWICVASQKNNEVAVYNSVAGRIDRQTIQIIAGMLKCKDQEFSVKHLPVQQQTNGDDCGLFAIAFATDLAANIEPTTRKYDQEKFREHLLKCFKYGEISIFPGVKHNVVFQSNLVSKTSQKTYRLFCICRDICFDENLHENAGNLLIECDVCRERYQQECVNISKHVRALSNKSCGFRK